VKLYKTIKIITIILLTVIIFIASFFGIYKIKDYKVINVVPNYTLGMEFVENRVIDLTVDSTTDKIIYDSEGNEIIEEPGVEYTEENGYKIVETKVNSEDVLKIENYKETKKILKNRLKGLGIDQYKITLDETNGNLKIKVANNDDTDNLIYNLLEPGTFEIKDSETEEVLIDASKFKKADVVYSYPQNEGQTETIIFLQIKFNEEGTKKLEELSKIYIEKITETINENGEKEQVDESKKVGIYYNEVSMGEIPLDGMVLDKMLYIGIGSAKDSETLQQQANEAEEIVAILNSGRLPITYTETNHVEAATITQQQIKIGIYVALAIVALMIIIFVVILKAKGIFASILQIGFISLLLFVLRYTNVKITIEGIGGIVLGAIINCAYLIKAFKNIDLHFIKDTTAKIALKLIPVYVIAIVLSFSKIANIYSIGMTLVWSIIIMYLYNLIITKILIDTIKE